MMISIATIPLSPDSVVVTNGRLTDPTSVMLVFLGSVTKQLLDFSSNSSPRGP